MLDLCLPQAPPINLEGFASLGHFHPLGIPVTRSDPKAWTVGGGPVRFGAIGSGFAYTGQTTEVADHGGGWHRVRMTMMAPTISSADGLPLRIV